jgi:large subunit ribosomal protein L2
MSRDTFEEITKSTPEKRLIRSKNSIAGRNNQGRLTVRHRGSGHRKNYRMIDYKRIDKSGVDGAVAAIEYDPNRSAYIMLVQYKDGDKRYHVAPEGMKVGDEILTKTKCKIRKGNRMQVKNIPIGYAISDVELTPGRGGQLARAAGASVKLVSLEGEKAQIQLSSGEIRLIEKRCYATIGNVGNLDHSNISIGKAGRTRWMGHRPQVRGKAMNPVDHPHGGGEGRCPIGLKHPKTPWGMPALGFKTRRRKSTNKFIIKRRPNKKLDL